MAKSGVKKSENPYLQRENVQILRVRGSVRSKKEGKKEYSCRVTHPDVEASGMTIFVDCGKYDYAPGEWVTFTFNVPNKFSVGGRVIWIQPVARNNRIIREKSVYSIRLGIEFDKSKEEDQLLIANFLAYLENPFFILSDKESPVDANGDVEKTSEAAAEAEGSVEGDSNVSTDAGDTGDVDNAELPADSEENPEQSAEPSDEVANDEAETTEDAA